MQNKFQYLTMQFFRIACNGEGISDVADFQHQSQYEAPQLNLK